MTAAGGTITEPTYYEILGVSEDADKEEIRAAWLPLINSIHPDRETDPEAIEDANRRSALVNAAYNTLKNPRERARYDAELQRQRGEQPAARPEEETARQGPQDRTERQTYDDYLSEEEEEELWERIQREAEAEAEEAWSRWENPPARERLAEALSELRDYDLSKVRLKGYSQDSFWAQLELRRQRPEANLLFNLPVLTAVMGALSLGELLVISADVLYGAAPLLALVAATFVLDFLLTAFGARPLRYLATRAGSAVRLSEGQKLAGVLTLTVRAVWGGVVGFFGAGLAIGFASSLAGIVFPVELFRSVITQALVLVPIVWTLIALGIWAKRAIGNDSTPDQETQR